MASHTWIAPAYEELIRQGAGGEVLYHDDTTMKVLALMKENRVPSANVHEPAVATAYAHESWDPNQEDDSWDAYRDLHSHPA